jgi:hypothetical protein
VTNILTLSFFYIVQVAGREINTVNEIVYKEEIYGHIQGGGKQNTGAAIV